MMMMMMMMMITAVQQWCMPLIPALRRQRQADLCKFKASQVYRSSHRTARDTQRILVWKKKHLL